MSLVKVILEITFQLKRQLLPWLLLLDCIEMAPSPLLQRDGLIGFWTLRPSTRLVFIRVMKKGSTMSGFKVVILRLYPVSLVKDGVSIGWTAIRSGSTAEIWSRGKISSRCPPHSSSM